MSDLVLLISDEAKRIANVLIEKNIVPEFKEFASKEDLEKMKNRQRPKEQVTSRKEKEAEESKKME